MRGVGLPACHEAACSNSVLVIELMLDRGADINSQCKGGFTPLHTAASSGSLSVLELLLSKGTDINLKSNDGSTPLLEATKKGTTSAVELLLNKGADINTQSINGHTPLYEAVVCLNQYTLELLQEKGANVNAPTTEGYTCLHEASRSGMMRIVEMLLNNGADVNAQDKNGNTPLHEAVRFGRTSVVKQLLNKTNDLNEQKKEGEALPYQMLQLKNAEYNTQVIHRRANVMLKNRAGDIPFTYSLLFFFKGNEEIVNLLAIAQKEATTEPMLNKQLSQNPQDIFQDNSQIVIIDSCKKRYEFKYLKTTEGSGLSGQLYETKMVSLIFIRVLNHEEIERDIFLGTNIDGIGAMDDICLRYQVRGQQRPVVLFIQVKHREDPEKRKLTEDSLWTDSSDFTLHKYFKSYLMIKDRFSNGNIDPMFEGNFYDVYCYFVLYRRLQVQLK